MRAVYLAVLMFLVAAPASAVERVGLVIGNAAYQAASTLKNPPNDAERVAIALEAAGFQVERRFDQSLGELKRALRDFSARARGADSAVVYYAGHGIEIDKQNYLVPVDARLEVDTDVDYEALPLELVARAVEGAERLSLVIVDACRDNPFRTTMTRTLGTRSMGRGLSAVEPAGNTLIAYAAREGTLAMDGIGENSPYADALAEALLEPGLEIGKLFRRVRDRVLAETDGVQEPFLYGSLSADDYFFMPPAAVVQTTGADVAAPAAAPTEAETSAAPSIDALQYGIWAFTTSTDTLEAYRTFLNQFPDGPYSEEARRRIARVEARDAALAAAPTTARTETTGEDEPNDDTNTVVALTTPPTGNQVSRRSVDMSARELNAAVQGELKRLGCNVGVVDGIWGPRSQRALAKAAETVALASIAPSIDALERLERREERACPLECAPTENKIGEQCVRKTCPSGQKLSSRGSCYVPQARAPEPEPYQAPAASPADIGSGDGPRCEMVGSYRVCRN
ncbi:MAG: caspase family protein [Pseudomonadota bacterium]